MQNRPNRRLTPQRRAVMRALEELGCAQDVDAIHARARRFLPRIGRVTVYRALDLLQAEGLVEALHLGDGRTRYELARTHHHHLICLRCGRLEPFEECNVAALARAARTRGFRVTGHRLELMGYCARCQIRKGPPCEA
ncbi:MAG: transcriptional repressor [Armatimonadota bacterium]|nr:transcriptional repressor [Armatimonadota bacterium]MDR7439289.1 transcriptional repressor [Armatimonadota bacterium]MDR7562066.1 transcriptional repressor [Armatimonadota bacterium]MDR7568010.1 transcriptional repressor [Armatimonadota bacterium]MDR7601107.1 transcriptional repressor [Armatimonadota bacterium]